jgi:hypothetical protein
MKIRQVGAEVSHADGQTDTHDETNSRFSQFFTEAPKNVFNPYHANVEKMVS